ncbi:probable L-type lectin-domain containing receptor kinase S.5 [Arachis hypogaea]
MFDHFIGFNFQHSNDMAHSLIPLYIVVAVLILVTIGIISIIRRFVYCLKCISKMISQSGSDKTLVNTLRNLPGTPKEYRFEDLKMATNNFDDVKNKLGQGGFGAVYRGTLPKDKTQVAVKKFLRDKISSTHDFLAELTIINSLRHKNLVRLLGWCHKNGILLLVYEYMPNGSLDHHLFFKEGTNKTPLSWHLRYKIISGLVAALNYLHNECDKKVIHRDLKASNIMLDSDFNARLGDFGLARAIENKKTSYANLHGVPGTMGYIAPECLYIGKATRESDVYGFGAVLLEVVCGQRPWTKNLDYQFLVDWVWHLHRQGRILEAVDPRLENEFEAEEAERVLKLGLACSHPIASERPKMQTIVQIISGSVPVPYVPPFKPPFVWPAADQSGASSGDPSSSEPTAATLEYSPINTTFFAR